MKRAVETHVVNPLARRLADNHPETPTVLSVTRREDGLKLRVTPLEEAARFPESARPAIGENIQAWLDRAHAALDRIEAQCRRHRPESPLGTGVVSPDYAWYLGMAEYLKETRKCALALVEKKDTDSRPDATSLQAPQPPTRKTRGGAWFRHHRRLSPERQILKEIFAAQDIQDYLRDLASAAETEVEYPGSATGVDELFDRLALAEMLAPTEDGWSRERALVLIRSIGDFPFCRTHTARSICRSVNFGADWESRWQEYAVEFGLQAVWFPRWPVERRNTDYFDSISTTWPEQIPDEAARERYRSRFFIDVVIIEGHRAGQFARLHEGTHLFALGDGRLQPVQVVVSPLAEGRSFGDLLGAILEQHLRREERDRGGPLDPFQWRPVVGLYSESGSLITDFRTGRLANHWPWNVGAALPLPAELPK
jgi:hypothetical protein